MAYQYGRYWPVVCSFSYNECYSGQFSRGKTDHDLGSTLRETRCFRIITFLYLVAVRMSCGSSTAHLFVDWTTRDRPRLAAQRPNPQRVMMGVARKIHNEGNTIPVSKHPMHDRQTWSLKARWPSNPPALLRCGSQGAVTAGLAPPNCRFGHDPHAQASSPGGLSLALRRDETGNVPNSGTSL